MTSIAFDGELLATDSQATCNDLIMPTQVVKIHHMHFSLLGECIFAGCGSEDDIINFTNFSSDWDISDSHDEGGMHIKFKGLQDGFEVPGGLLFTKEYNLVLYAGSQIASSFTGSYSQGSGHDIALALLISGKNAKETIDIVKELDIYSGGETQVFNIREWRESLK